MNLVPENICGSLRYQGHRKAHPVGPLSAKLCFQTRCCPIARYRSTDQFVRGIALVVSLGVEDLLKASLLEREDAELIRIYKNLNPADSEGLEHRTLTLAVRLQFAFAARMSEILPPQWDWIDFGNRRVAWPTSKTGSISDRTSTRL